MSITALPALNRTSATFRADVDTFMGSQLPTFSVEAEAARVAINAAAVTAEAARVTAQAAIDAGLASAATNASTATTKASEANISAIAAAASAASIAGGPVASVNGMTGVVTGVATQSGAETLTSKTIHGNANTLTADGTNAVGFRHIPQVSQSAAYTLVLTDAGKHILHPSADTTARIFTIPANASVAFPIGTAVTFVNQNAGGVITIAITTDTMRLAGAGTTGSRTLAANGVATAVKLTATEWLVSGSGLT